jgi:hypothetical protein
MSAWRMALFAAIAANVLGWVLPAVYDEAGWRAFRAALSPLWPSEGFKLDPGLLLVLSVASALTNVLFVVLAVVLTLREERARVVLWLAVLHGRRAAFARGRLFRLGRFVRAPRAGGLACPARAPPLRQITFGQNSVRPRTAPEAWAPGR